MRPRELTKGNTQLTRQNDFSFTSIKLVYSLTRKTLGCNSLVLKICMFLQKETSHCKSSLALGPQGPKRYILGNRFYSKNTRKLRFHVFLLSDDTKHMISSFYLKWTEFMRNYEFFSNYGSLGVVYNRVFWHNLDRAQNNNYKNQIKK